MKRWLLKRVLPVACRWVERHETRILRDGRRLTEAERRDACAVGVREPERVRVALVAAIPTDLPLTPRWLAPMAWWLTRDTIGITLGRGIYIRRERAADRGLLVHELAHVAQYERFGSVRGFLEAYLWECVEPGYPYGPLEQEAARKAAEVLPPRGH